MSTISILNNFSEFPGLRNCDISDNSGEEFYHNVLNKAFAEAYEKKERLVIDLDDTAGYASSFLDQAFGCLVYDFTLDIVKNYIEIISKQEPHWKVMLEEKTFKEWEQRRNENKPPKVTINHNAWYRLDGNKLENKIWEQPAIA